MMNRMLGRLAGCAPRASGVSSANARTKGLIADGARSGSNTCVRSEAKTDGSCDGETVGGHREPAGRRIPQECDDVAGALVGDEKPVAAGIEREVARPVTAGRN